METDYRQQAAFINAMLARHADAPLAGVERTQMGWEVYPEGLRDLRSEVTRWGPIVKASGAKAD